MASTLTPWVLNSLCAYVFDSRNKGTRGARKLAEHNDRGTPGNQGRGAGLYQLRPERTLEEVPPVAPVALHETQGGLELLMSC